MQLNNQYHVKDLLNRELFEVYFLLSMRKLATSMIGIFLPLYLLVELGLPLSNVIIFFVVMVLSMAIFLFPTMKIISKWGTKHSILISLPVLIAGMILTIYLQKNVSLYILTAILLGVDLALFWLGFHIDTVINSKKNALGKESAVIWMVNVLGVIIGPILGGIILYFFTFTVLFIVSMCLLVVSVIPLLLSKEVYAKTDYDLNYLLKDGHLKYFLAYFSQGIRSTSTLVLWPIFIFVILGSYFELGVYGTVATLFIAIFSYYIGHISDQMDKGVIIKLAAITDGVVWVIRIFVSTILEVFALGTLGGVTTMSVDIPLLAKSYRKAQKEKIAAFMLFRELSWRCGQLTILLVVLALGSIKWGFALAAVSTLLYFKS